MKLSPRTTLTLATWVLKVTGPVALAMCAGWLTQVLPDTRRMLAAYMTVLLVCVGSACVAALAACHLAIHQAFSAGYRTGQASVWPEDAETHPALEDDPVLRLVE